MVKNCRVVFFWEIAIVNTISQKSVLIFATLHFVSLFSLPHLTAQQPATLSQFLSPNHSAELRLTPAPHFVLTGLKSVQKSVEQQVDYQRFFDIHVLSEQTQTPPLLGEYRVEDSNTLSFIPRYPLSPSVVYCLRVGDALRRELGPTTEGKQPIQELRFQLPSQPPAKATSVAAIYPSADNLPENLLKFYLHFSAPMSRGQAYQRIQLMHGQEEIDKPFLELGEELWDAEQQRFTLFIHPGRIKHGLRSRDEAGPALIAGQTYTLRIDQAWIDAAGFPLSETIEKHFSVTPSDDAQLDPERWQIGSPTTGTLEPVTLTFDEPLDHAMLSRVLNVKARDESLVVGSTQVAADETEWRFTPTEKWRTGTYHIEVATILEDLCGNSLAKPFEVDLRNVILVEPKSHIAIEFIVK